MDFKSQRRDSIVESSGFKVTWRDINLESCDIVWIPVGLKHSLKSLRKNPHDPNVVVLSAVRKMSFSDLDVFLMKFWPEAAWRQNNSKKRSKS